MSENIQRYQPTGLCPNCLRLDHDPVLNCPRAQAARESGKEETIIVCDDFITLERDHG